MVQRFLSITSISLREGAFRAAGRGRDEAGSRLTRNATSAEGSATDSCSSVEPDRKPDSRTSLSRVISFIWTNTGSAHLFCLCSFTKSCWKRVSVRVRGTTIRCETHGASAAQTLTRHDALLHELLPHSSLLQTELEDCERAETRGSGGKLSPSTAKSSESPRNYLWI